MQYDELLWYLVNHLEIDAPVSQRKYSKREAVLKESQWGHKAALSPSETNNQWVRKWLSFLGKSTPKEAEKQHQWIMEVSSPPWPLESYILPARTTCTRAGELHSVSRDPPPMWEETCPLSLDNHSSSSCTCFREPLDTT